MHLQVFPMDFLAFYCSILIVQNVDLENKSYKYYCIMKGKGATTQIKIYFTSSSEMCKEVSMVEPCFSVLINP